MPHRLVHMILLVLAGALLASTSSAAIVRVKYEGDVNVVGSNTAGFSVGDKVWGEYYYDSQSPPIVGSMYASEHAAIRYLSINASGGFSGAVSFGVINAPIPYVLYNRSLFMDASRPDVYRVTNWPAIVLTPPGLMGHFDIDDGHFGGGPFSPDGIADDIDRDGHFGPDGYDLDDPSHGPDTNFPPPDSDDLVNLPTFAPDIASLLDAANRSASLGFPGPSGAFTQGRPVAIHLLMYSDSPPPSGAADPLAPPPLDAVQTAKGSIYFGYFGTDDPQYKVEFALTSIAVVPEPASLILILAGIISTVSCRRQQSGSGRSTGV